MSSYILGPIRDLKATQDTHSSLKYFAQGELLNILYLFPMTSLEAAHTLRGSVNIHRVGF